VILVTLIAAFLYATTMMMGMILGPLAHALHRGNSNGALRVGGGAFVDVNVDPSLVDFNPGHRYRRREWPCLLRL